MTVLGGRILVRTREFRSDLLHTQRTNRHFQKEAVGDVQLIRIQGKNNKFALHISSSVMPSGKASDVSRALFAGWLYDLVAVCMQILLLPSLHSHHLPSQKVSIGRNPKLQYMSMFLAILLCTALYHLLYCFSKVHTAGDHLGATSLTKTNTRIFHVNEIQMHLAASVRTFIV